MIHDNSNMNWFYSHSICVQVVQALTVKHHTAHSSQNTQPNIHTLRVNNFKSGRLNSMSCKKTVIAYWVSGNVLAARYNTCTLVQKQHVDPHLVKPYCLYAARKMLLLMTLIEISDWRDIMLLRTIGSYRQHCLCNNLIIWLPYF